LLRYVCNLRSDICRTRIYLLLRVIALVSGSIIPPLGSKLMARVGPALAYLISVPFILVPLVILYFIPETKSSQSDSDEWDDDHPDATVPEAASPSVANIQSIMEHVKKNFLPFFRSSIILRSLIVLFLATIGEALTGVYLQYMRFKFDWDYQQVLQTLPSAQLR